MTRGSGRRATPWELTRERRTHRSRRRGVPLHRVGGAALLDQCVPGAAGRRRRAVGDGRSAPVVRSVLLYRADADGLHRARRWRSPSWSRPIASRSPIHSGAAVATRDPARLRDLPLTTIVAANPLPFAAGFAVLLAWTFLGARARFARYFDWIARRRLARHLRLYRGPLRAADLRDRDAAGGRHRRQRDPDLPRARRQPPHLRLGLRRHHPGDGGLYLHLAASAGRLRHPQRLARAPDRLSRPRHQRHHRRDRCTSPCWS